MINNQDTLVDIFSRLPAKSIGRFRCVSKPWKSLLLQPHFIKTHLNRIKQYSDSVESLIFVTHQPNSLFIAQLRNAHQLFDEMTVDAANLSFDHHLFDSESVIGSVASCDGLTLIEDVEKLLLLVNLTTKEFKVLPKSPFALDSRISFTMYGFGYDSVSDDYKVVSISYYDTDNEHEYDCTEMSVNVYSVNNGTWKKALSSPYDHAVGKLTSGILVAGRIHWLACRTSDYSSVIVAFDLGEEQFHEVPPPSSFDGKRFVFNNILTLGGCLCLFAMSRSYRTDVWVMKEYGVRESWTKFTIVDTQRSEFRPICLLGTDQVVLVKDEETTREKLVMYNLNEGRFKDIVVQGRIPNAFCVGGTFTESLISPHGSVDAAKEE